MRPVGLRTFALCALTVVVVTLIIMAMSMSVASAQQTRNIYVYVEPVPSYAPSYTLDALHSAEKRWQDANPQIAFYDVNSPQQANLYVQWIRDTGAATVGETFFGGNIQVSIGNSLCLNRWEPFSAASIEHIAEHEIGHFLGLQHSTDPSSIMYPQFNTTYGIVTVQRDLASDYAWFVPSCDIANKVTSYQYTVNTTDSKNGIDVYFVPSKAEYDNASNGQPFLYYSAAGCFGKDFLRYTGTCSGVASDSGLLILTHTQSDPLETISVQMLDQSPAQNTVTPISPTAPTPVQPSDPQIASITALASASSLEVGQSVRIFGIAYDANHNPIPGTKVDVTIGTTTVQATTDASGAYSATIQATSVGTFTPVVRAADSSAYAVTAPIQVLESHSGPIAVQGTGFWVNTKITGAIITSISVDPSTNSIIVHLIPNGDGRLTITQPRSLIDATQSDGTDSQFVVMQHSNLGPSSNVQVYYGESKNGTSRTLDIPFTRFADSIQIIGTHVVPEFPLPLLTIFGAMVIAIAIGRKLARQLGR